MAHLEHFFLFFFFWLRNALAGNIPLACRKDKVKKKKKSAKEDNRIITFTS